MIEKKIQTHVLKGTLLAKMSCRQYQSWCCCPDKKHISSIGNKKESHFLLKGVKGVDIASFIQIQRIHLHSQFSF